MKDNQKLDYIYHFAIPEVWSKFENEAYYFPDAYEEEGFIHCSFFHQIEKVKERHYKGKTIKVLKLDASLIGESLIVEASTKGEMYPHIYGHLKKEWILSMD